ncbi:MAG: menaquinone biosynthesis protein [Vicinamibacteria bacterium]
MPTPLRIGLFPYLNVQPLVFGLRGESAFELVVDVPSRIADLFRKGELDLAMVPSFEAATLGAPVVEPVCISSDGPVETVLLHHRTPLAQVKTVALDEASRTSATLSKILIAQASGQLPATSSYAAKQHDAPDADAILVIGDPAFRFARAGFEPLDLGGAWKTQERAPFVFALMVAGPRALATPHLGQRLKTANAKGLNAASTIASSYNSGVDAARAERYLRSVIRYDLGPREKEGLRRFYALAQSNGLLKDVKELQFHAI